MAAFRPLCPSLIRNIFQSRLTFVCGRRTLLSAAYACNSVWEARKQNVILKDLNPYDFIAEINRQAQKGHMVSAVDIDVLWNCIDDTEQFDEALRLLYKFRHSPKAAEILPSTHSAFVRMCLKHGRDELLLRILDDPINYGIFLDSHDAGLLMDHFLKNGNHRDAAKVASKIMLQEDFDRSSTCWLAALSCLKWIKEPVPSASSSGEGDTATAEGRNQEDDDEIIFRVPYLKNHYFDDHFDITELPALVGKTLAWSARYLNNEELASNLTALGYGVKNDYKNLALVLRRQLEKRTKFYAEVERYILAAKAESEAKPAESAEPVEEPTSDAETRSESDVELEDLKNLVEQFRKSDLIIQEDLEESILEELGKVLPELESKDIEERMSILNQWNDKQQQKIENQVLRYLKKERLKELEKERQDIQEMEEYLTFFENRTKLETSVHPELLKQEAEAQQKLQEEKKQLPSDDKYVIPELGVKREEQKLEF